jgi:hypothetical protein
MIKAQILMVSVYHQSKGFGRRLTGLFKVNMTIHLVGLCLARTLSNEAIYKAQSSLAAE